MTLGYSTKIKGKPNHFVEKIWAGLISEIKGISINDYEIYSKSHMNKFGTEMSEYVGVFIDPKIHTIRADNKDRWKAGNNIHSVINNRTKNRFQFAPVVPCVSAQKIKITYLMGCGDYPSVKIDGHILKYNKIEQLAKNDGFDSVEDFFAWFDWDFEGKIIHWTNFKY